MIRCLCCGKAFQETAEETEIVSGWHRKCIKSFFGTKNLPDIDATEEVLNLIAIESTSKGYTIPGVQMALTLNEKKRNLRKKDFLILAEKCYIEKKVALKLIDSILKKRENLMLLCRESYLPEDMKENLIQLMEERMEVLG